MSNEVSVDRRVVARSPLLVLLPLLCLMCPCELSPVAVTMCVTGQWATPCILLEENYLQKLHVIQFFSGDMWDGSMCGTMTLTCCRKLHWLERLERWRLQTDRWEMPHGSYYLGMNLKKLHLKPEGCRTWMQRPSWSCRCETWQVELMSGSRSSSPSGDGYRTKLEPPPSPWTAALRSGLSPQSWA